MPLYMDRHHNIGANWNEIQYDHEKDIALQDEYDVKFLTYWFDEGRDSAFCLVSAPSADALTDIHSAAHGSIPNDIVEVEQSSVMSFMGRIADIPADKQGDGRPIDRAFRAIMFTDLVGYTAMTDRLGDELAIKLLRQHNSSVRESLLRFGGREVKHTGDGFMASFNKLGNALQCAVEIQSTNDSNDTEFSGTSQVRIGISAGEPIEEDGDLFGTSVNLASRLCDAAGPGEIFLSQEFTEALDDTSFRIEQLRPLRLKGFASAQAACRVVRGPMAHLR